MGYISLRPTTTGRTCWLLAVRSLTFLKAHFVVLFFDETQLTFKVKHLLLAADQWLHGLYVMGDHLPLMQGRKYHQRSPWGLVCTRSCGDGRRPANRQERHVKQQKSNEQEAKSKTQECRGKEVKEHKTRSETEKAGRKAQKPGGRRERPLVSGSTQRDAPASVAGKAASPMAKSRPAGKSRFPGCYRYEAEEGGTIGEFARGGTEMRQSEDILLDLKEMSFLCSCNITLTLSWTRKTGDEHRYDICGYQHRWPC